MKIVVYIILILSFLISGCKRKRKINVEGTVTDIYTGQSVPGIIVKLHSQIETGVSGGTTNDYETITDEEGHYRFINAVFSKPGNRGWLEIPIAGYESIYYMDRSENDIPGEDIKFIGKTNLTKNMPVICLSHLNLSIAFSPSIQATSAGFYLKFIGSVNIPGQYSEFNQIGSWPETQSNKIPSKLIGYTNGKIIIKTQYLDHITQTYKTQYDTIVSQGCGSVNNYTITLH